MITPVTFELTYQCASCQETFTLETMLNYKDGTVAGLLESMMYTVDIKTKKDLGDIGLSILVDVSTVAPELGVGREYIFDDSHNKVCCARLLHNCKDESIVGVANLVSIRRKDGKRLST